MPIFAVIIEKMEITVHLMINKLHYNDKITANISVENPFRIYIFGKILKHAELPGIS